LLVVLSLLRVVFLPLFLLSNVAIPGRRLPSLIQHDAIPTVAEVLLGFTNGYIGTLAMMYGPQ